ncbi:ABC-three component system protein [Enterococcus hirae]
MNDFEELSVNIRGTNTYGSGLLYQQDCETGYVITAKHCVVGETINDFKLFDYTQSELEILEPPRCSDSLDLAIIKVKVKKGYPELLIMEPENKQEIVFYGYPECMKEDGGTPYRGKATQISKPDIFKLVLDNEIGSSNNTEYENIRGCSGSGVYVEREGKCYLTGIITKLQSAGQQGIVEGIHIAHIVAFFLEEFDIMLVPRCLNDFSGYLTSIINELREVGGQENKLIFLIEKCYRECFSDITPKLIHNRLSDYLFLPSQKNEDYTNKFLWIAWLEILLYKLLQTNIAFEIDDCFKLLTQEKERSGIHVLLTDCLSLDHFIGSLFRSTLYDKIDKQDILVVSSEEIFIYGSFIAKRDQIEGIVTSIDHPEVSDRLAIDDPNEKKLFPIVHIYYIESKIYQFLHDTKGLTAVEFSQRFPEELTRLFEEIAN